MYKEVISRASTLDSFPLPPRVIPERRCSAIKAEERRKQDDRKPLCHPERFSLQIDDQFMEDGSGPLHFYVALAIIGYFSTLSIIYSHYFHASLLSPPSILCLSPSLSLSFIATHFPAAFILQLLFFSRLILAPLHAIYIFSLLLAEHLFTALHLVWEGGRTGPHERQLLPRSTTLSAGDCSGRVRSCWRRELFGVSGQPTSGITAGQ